MVSNGNPNNRYSYLEHRWTVNLASGTNPVFYVEAHHTPNIEGDDFVFAYSTNGSNFTTMLTVAKTADDDIAQSFVLPANVTGTITIRVQDANRVRRNVALDSVFVDELYVRTQQ